MGRRFLNPVFGLFVLIACFGLLEWPLVVHVLHFSVS